jgi:hypothetical protein
MCIEGAWAPTAEGEVDRHLRSECLTAQPPPGRPRVARAHTRHQGSSRHSRQLSPLHFMTMMLAASIAYNPLRVYNAGLQRRVPTLRRGGLRHSVAQKAPEISRQVHAAQAIRRAAGARIESALGLPSGPDRNHFDSRGELGPSVGDRGPHQPRRRAAIQPDPYPRSPRLRARERRTNPRLLAGRLERLPGRPARAYCQGGLTSPVRLDNDAGVTLLLVALSMRVGYSPLSPETLCLRVQDPLWVAVLVF